MCKEVVSIQVRVMAAMAVIGMGPMEGAQPLELLFLDPSDAHLIILLCVCFVQFPVSGLYNKKVKCIDNSEA